MHYNLSIITINHNGINDTIKCIDSLIVSKLADAEIICVDNGANNNEFEILSEKYKNFFNIRIFKTVNKGFGNACNYGAKKSKGKFLFFLNNDTYVLKNSHVSIEELDIQTIYAPIVYNKDLTLQSNTGKYFDGLGIFLFSINFGKTLRRFKPLHVLVLLLFPKLHKRYREPTAKKFWISGCALLINKNHFVEIGLFDEAYFMYLEDQELCLRNSKMGGEVAILKEIELIHFLGQSGRSIEKRIKKYKIDSALKFSKMYNPKWHSFIKLYHSIFS